MREKKRVIQKIISILLILIIMVSVCPLEILAESTIFLGVEDIEVGENERIDLKNGVSAIGENDEILDVQVVDVISQNDEEFSYDGSGYLVTGKVGTVYLVKYSTGESQHQRSITVTKPEILEEICDEDKNGEDQDIEESINIQEEKDNLPVENSSEELLSDGNEEELFSDGTEKKGNLTVEYYTGRHYIKDPDYPDPITLFCLNNKLWWPHHMENMGNMQVPSFTNGYLTPEQFESKEAYNNFMRSLSALLYAGYPHNGRNLYKIVSISEQHLPTEEEFNRLLIPDPMLVVAFPYLGKHKFTYEDWKINNLEHLQVLNRFINDAFQLFINKTTTTNGLDYEDICNTPFYKAAWCMDFRGTETPLQNFADFYSDSYYVTDEQAYDATQYAIWHLMQHYNIADNDFVEISKSRLAESLYKASKSVRILNYKPSVSEISLTGDLTFTYHPKDQMWHSGRLRINEPELYDAIYQLILPQGVTSLSDNLTHVYGNEEFELVSDHRPIEGEQFGIKTTLSWLQDVRQYSPSPDVEIAGKKFQHMAGAVVRKETLETAFPYTASEEGSLSIEKTAIGGDEHAEFIFQIQLSDPNINGVYGPVTFYNGGAEFLSKSGQKIEIPHLPVGITYQIIEADYGDYEITSVNASGTILPEQTISVSFVNTLRPDLTIQKKVTGEAGDRKKKFTFQIFLKDKEGQPVNDIFDYLGYVPDNYGNEIEKPEDGKITFTNGIGEIQLSHGQQITIRNLPYDSTYTITEKESKSYITTYNGCNSMDNQKLIENQIIQVVNNKEFVPDTGITNTDYGSRIMILIVAIVGMCVCLIHFCRKRGRK